MKIWNTKYALTCGVPLLLFAIIASYAAAVIGLAMLYHVAGPGGAFVGLLALFGACLAIRKIMSTLRCKLQAEIDAALWEERARHLGWRDDREPAR